MATTRLNEGHREALRALAQRVLDCPDEAKAEAAAYKKTAPLVRKLIEDRFPAADMAVLRKYELARTDTCVYLQLTAGGVEQFTFHDDEPVTVAGRSSCSSRIYPANDRVSEAVSLWMLADSALKKALDQKRATYSAFIRAAQTFEQVLEVWPEAAELGPAIARNLPVAVSADTLAQISADSARRMKSASRTKAAA